MTKRRERWSMILAFAGLLCVSACGGGSSNTPPPTVPPPSGLSYETPPTYLVGLAIDSLMPSVTGTPTSYSVSPALPTGLTLDTTHGWITGTPAVTTPTASYTIRAENAGGAASFSLSLTVDPAAPSLRLEPIRGTTIGVGQPLMLHVAHWGLSTDPFPEYVDPALVTWDSSQPGVASIGSDGVVSGLSAGSTVITASYQSLTKEILIVVSGSFLDRDVAVSGQGVRHYSVFVPSSVAPGTPLPVILALHGGGGSARNQASVSLLNELAESRKILVAYPEGRGVFQTFNAGSCCGFAQTNSIDDVAYVRAVLDDIIARDGIDTDRIYATGFSNGAMMSHRLACEMADRLAGIAAVSGASGEFDLDLNQFYACSPARPVPILHVHATNDRDYPLAGGVGTGISGTNFYPVDATVSDWIARNNVATEAAIERPAPTTTCARYARRVDATKPSAPVTLCTIDPMDVFDPVTEIVFGGGHSWPGGNRFATTGSDTPVTDFSVNTFLWDYFGH